MPAKELLRLARQGAPARPAVRLGPSGGAGAELALGRAHEVCGPAREVFAALVAGLLRGPVLRILPAWGRERPWPDGLAPFFDPGRLVLAMAGRAEDLLWCAEEALRSGACPLVTVELETAPGLTPVRRLHLAAEAAAGTGGPPPLALLLTPEPGGAQGVETRWRVSGAPGGRWRLELLRARAAPPRAWIVSRRPDGALSLAPEAKPAAAAE